MWIIKTIKDKMEWKFEDFEHAIIFYDKLTTYGENATYPKFIE